jgi:hypothetical protein
VKNFIGGKNYEPKPGTRISRPVVLSNRRFLQITVAHRNLDCSNGGKRSNRRAKIDEIALFLNKKAKVFIQVPSIIGYKGI